MISRACRAADSWAPPGPEGVGARAESARRRSRPSWEERSSPPVAGRGPSRGPMPLDCPFTLPISRTPETSKETPRRGRHQPFLEPTATVVPGNRQSAPHRAPIRLPVFPGRHPRLHSRTQDRRTASTMRIGGMLSTRLPHRGPSHLVGVFVVHDTGDLRSASTGPQVSLGLGDPLPQFSSPGDSGLNECP